MMLPPSMNSTFQAPSTFSAEGRPAIRLAEQQLTPHSNGLTDISGVPVTIDLGGSSAWQVNTHDLGNRCRRALESGWGEAHPPFAKFAKGRVMIMPHVCISVDTSSRQHCHLR